MSIQTRGNGAYFHPENHSGKSDNTLYYIHTLEFYLGAYSQRGQRKVEKSPHDSHRGEQNETVIEKGLVIKKKVIAKNRVHN